MIMNYNEVLEILAPMYAIIGVISVAGIAANIFAMLAVGADCKAKNIKNRTIWMVFTFISPIIVGIIYLCLRKKEAAPAHKVCSVCGFAQDESAVFCTNCGNNTFVPNESSDKAKNIKNSKVFLGFAIFFAVAVIVSECALMVSMIDTIVDMPENELFTEEFGSEFTYYDKNGFRYDERDDIVYYDKEGNVYEYDYDEAFGAYFESADGKKYDAAYSFVDEDGFFYFDAAGADDESKSSLDFYGENNSYADKDGKLYYYADSVRWDAQGNMLNDYSGVIIEPKE